MANVLQFDQFASTNHFHLFSPHGLSTDGTTDWNTIMPFVAGGNGHDTNSIHQLLLWIPILRRLWVGQSNGNSFPPPIPPPTDQ